MDKILEIFIREPEKEFHVRAIARLVGKSPTTVSAYLARFAKEGVLMSEKKFNHLIYRANSEGKSFRQLKRNYNLDVLGDSGLVEFIEVEFNHPEVIGLFGSFAKGDNIARGDVDVFVVSPVKKELNLRKYGKKIGHKIQLFVFSRNDIERMKKSNKELLNNLLNGIILSGHLEVFR